ncbi:Holliday junction branch migration protein RuvA [Candidatus Saccharibacteria bacterium]|jgi:Holliday junction DNA helicase RuvA|nr:Holliday junction branch migration protein RuvA [Candidatus Saccharibacteria bacterium]
MIYSLTGKLVEAQNRQVIIDCSGVGYGVIMSQTDLMNLALDEQVSVLIFENIKEDMYDLYGFSNANTKQLFEQLISVKNVGPKVALALLDTDTDQGLRVAIAGGDVAHLKRAKGVGKRAAEQIVVELRDKVDIIPSEAAEGVVTRSGLGGRDEAMQALVSLGYSEADAEEALRPVDKELSTEDRIKQALRGGKF